MNANTKRTMRAPNKKGPRKLKSWPLLAAQKVYNVRLITTAVVNMTASKITLPEQLPVGTVSMPVMSPISRFKSTIASASIFQRYRMIHRKAPADDTNVLPTQIPKGNLEDFSKFIKLDQRIYITKY